MRERGRECIEVDAGADTKTTSKIWKRKNEGKKKQVAIETNTWLRGRGLKSHSCHFSSVKHIQRMRLSHWPFAVGKYGIHAPST